MCLARYILLQYKIVKFINILNIKKINYKYLSNIYQINI